MGYRASEYDGDNFDDYDAEAQEEHRVQGIKARLTAGTPEALAKEWNWQCRRHDSAVDRCEEINSPTIEDAAGWMRWIEGEFKRRGLNYHDFLREETETSEIG